MDLQIYVDESLHDNAGFIAVALFTTGHQIAPLIDQALLRAGLKPNVDEYKSTTLMNGNAALQAMRKELVSIANDVSAKLGIVVLDRSERDQISFHVAKALKAIVENNQIVANSIEIFFDQEIDVSGANQFCRSDQSLNLVQIWLFSTIAFSAFAT